MPLLVLLLLLPLAVVALMPLMLLQRYRLGTARRLVRPWFATVNVALLTASAAFLLITAAVTSVWVPAAFTSTLLGMAVGAVLGTISLKLSRWEETPRALHYTANRWLVLAITLLVSARILYGFWRGWTSLHTNGSGSFIAAFGVAGSLGAGAIVLGYYLAFGVGLKRRIRYWQKRPLRVMR